jgi:hypothetical protein
MTRKIASEFSIGFRPKGHAGSCQRPVKFQTPSLSVVLYAMPPTWPNIRPDIYITNPQFSVKFYQKRYNVDCILQERPVAAVYAVSSSSKHRAIKIVCSF